MRFLCLAYEEERHLALLQPQEWQELRRETLEYVEELRASGVLLSAEPLQRVRTASTVRVRSGQVTVTDGPFAETKEQLGGFFLIEASDKTEAMSIAARWPSARFGSIEVRPLEDGLSQSGRYASERI